MTKTTEDLQNEITRARTLEELRVMQEKNAKHFLYPSALEYLVQTAAVHGLERKNFAKQVLDQTSLEKAYVYHLLSGAKNMTRDKLIIFAIVGHFTLDEVNNLLKYAGEATLYSRNKRDAILEFIFNKHHSLVDANICLAEMQQEILK